MNSQPSDKKVLLIDRCQATREARAAILRSHGVAVRTAEDLSGARVLWNPNVYDLVMLNVRNCFPEEAFAFYKQIKDASPGEHFAFLVGPPTYLSLTWPETGMAAEMAAEQEPRQWAETVKRFLAAA